MTYQEFLDDIKTLNISPEEKGAVYERSYSYYNKGKKLKLGKSAIVEKWCTGGISGGSCYDDGTSDHHYAMSGESEPDFSDLDSILEHFCPNIGFLTYKKICANLIKEEDYTVGEYYGNSSSYREKFVYLDDLYKELNDRGLLTNT